MSMMDLKSKGKTWFGGVHKKFGAILYDAAVANKDAIHHVEGQVKNVNEPSTNKGQRMADIGSCVEEFIVTEDFFVDSGFIDSPLQPKPADPMENSELDLVTRLVSPSADYSQKVKSALSPEQAEGVLRNEKLGVSIEEDTVEDKSSVSDGELIFHSEKESLQSSLLRDDNSESSDYAKKFESHSKARMISSYFTEDLDCPSAASSFATYSDLDFSSVPREKQIDEAGLVSCSSSLLTESENLDTNAAAVSCDDSVRFDASSSDCPSLVISSPVLSSKNDALAVQFVSSSSLPLSESIDESTSRINKVSLWTGSSGNGHVWFREHAQSGALTSSFGLLEDSSDIITDPDMETIDLLDEVKAEADCVNVSSRELYAASHRAHKLRSYKKKMQDAFYSKKRLAREYELLAIWFGDADIEDRFVPSISTTSLNSTSTQTNHAPEPDWELL